MLYLIASPIGNLGDITQRALEVLSSVDLIASEDTRHTKKLLAHYHIDTQLTSYHDHSSESKRNKLVNMLKQGSEIALISDAGTPLVNDPGYRLVRACIDEEIQVTALPGPSSVLNALVLSGFATDRFQFVGYLPVKEGKKRTQLEEIRDATQTTICLESPHRLVKTLKLASDVLEDRAIAVCREMTKKFEEVKRGNAGELHSYFEKKPPKGEITLVIEGS